MVARVLQIMWFVQIWMQSVGKKGLKISSSLTTMLELISCLAYYNLSFFSRVYIGCNEVNWIWTQIYICIVTKSVNKSFWLPHKIYCFVFFPWIGLPTINILFIFLYSLSDYQLGRKEILLDLASFIDNRVQIKLIVGIE